MAKMIMTVAEMADRHAWLKMRTQGIGGSDAGTIVGVNPWKSKYELWLEKTGQVVPEDISDREPVYWGNQLEDIVAQEFTRKTGKKVRRHGMVQDEEHPFLFANVDRMVAGEKAGLECKTANGFKAALWEGDEVPASYYCQCQHYMLVTGLPVWYIACLVGGQHYVWKPIERNEEDIQTLLEMEEAFWKCSSTVCRQLLTAASPAASPSRNASMAARVTSSRYRVIWSWLSGASGSLRSRRKTSSRN